MSNYYRNAKRSTFVGRTPQAGINMIDLTTEFIFSGFLEKSLRNEIK